MPDNAHPLPPTSPEHRRAAAGQFERANQVIATGNHDYGIKLLLSCCKLDPSNIMYRKMFREVVREFVAAVKQLSPAALELLEK